MPPSTVKDGDGRIKTDYDFASKEDADRFRAHDREVVEADEPRRSRYVEHAEWPRRHLRPQEPVHLDGYPGAVGGIAIEVNEVAR